MGLLDGLDNDVTRFGLGLLAASGSNANFGQNLASAVGSLDQFKQQKAQARRAQQQEEFMQFQMQQARAQVEAQKAAQEAAARKAAAIPGLFRSPQTQAQVSIPQMGGADMFSQGANVEVPSMRGARQFDLEGALRAGLNADEIEKYAKLNDLGRAEVKDWQDIEGPNGAKLRQGFDKFGQPVGNGASGYVAPVQINQGGGGITFAKPVAGANFPVTMTASEKDASSRGWAGVRQGDERLSMERKKFAQETANGGYSAKPLPAAALKMQNDAIDAISTASGINEQLAKVATQIDTGKLSFGPLSNALGSARNSMGMSNEQSRNLASFKSTMEKLRNDSLRLNSGVQTDGDAQRAWNELFQNINDTDLVKQRLVEISSINKRAEELQRLKVDQIRGNYNAPPMDFKPLLSVPSGTGGGASGGWGIQKVN